MLVIRYQRVGKRNDAAFRIVVIEKQEGPKSGNVTEYVGSYHPKTKEVTLNEERIKYWISVGAQPSDTVNNLLISKGVIEGEKVNVLPKKSPIKKEESEAPAEAAPEAPAEDEDAPETEAPVEETPAEPKEEVKEEESTEAPAEEAQAEEKE